MRWRALEVIGHTCKQEIQSELGRKLVFDIRKLTDGLKDGRCGDSGEGPTAMDFDGELD